jgi:hypothetical protein
MIKNNKQIFQLKPSKTIRACEKVSKINAPIKMTKAVI